MLSYLNSSALGALAPNVVHNGSYTLGAGLTATIIPTGFPPPNEYTTYLNLVISNTQPAGSGDDLILAMDNSPVQNQGIVIFPQSHYTVDARAINYINAQNQAINSQPWPLGGESMWTIHNPNAGPVRFMTAWLGVM